MIPFMKMLRVVLVCSRRHDSHSSSSEEEVKTGAKDSENREMSKNDCGSSENENSEDGHSRSERSATPERLVREGTVESCSSRMRDDSRDTITRERDTR